MKRRVLAILVTALMVFQSIPATAFAADTPAVPNQVGNYYEVYDENGTLKTDTPKLTGSTVQSYESGAVKVNKTITQTTTENVFDVELTVSTTEEITTETDINSDAAVVLVLDASRSMRTCVADNCGHIHKNVTKNGDDASGDCGQEDCKCTSETLKQRSTAVREAAQEFINSFAAADSNRMIAIVEFGGYKPDDNDDKHSFIAGATRLQNWTSASDLTATAGNYCTALKGYDYRYAGTNIEAGLILAENLLNASAVSKIKNKNVILLSDGAPTYHVGNTTNEKSTESVCTTSDNTKGNGTSGQSICALHRDPATVAARMRTNKITTYAAYVGNDMVKCGSCGKNQSGSDWLAKDCGFTTITADSAGGIADAFQKLEQLIELKAKAWIVTDPMGSRIFFEDFNQEPVHVTEFTEEDGTIKWDIKSGSIPTTTTQNNKTTYTYKLNYQITLNNLSGGYTAGTYYPANDVTGLTYLVEKTENGITTYEDGTAYFNIPSVKGFDAELTLANAKYGQKYIGSDVYEPLANAGFQVAHASDCACGHNTAWSVTGKTNASGTLTIDKIPSGHKYVLTETAAPDGYIKSEGSYTFEVSYGNVVNAVNNGLFNMEYDGKAVIGNESTKYRIPVSKSWNDDENRDKVRPASITAGLYAAGSTEPVDTVVLNAAGGWAGVFDTVPKYDADGAEIEYTVKEIGVPDGYTVAVSGDEDNGFIITNTYQIETKDISVTKRWDDANDQDGLRKSSVAVQLKAGEDVIAEATLSEDNNWTVKWEDLPAKENGTDIVYTVAEKSVPEGYTPSITGSVEDGFVITNTHEPAVTKATIKKVWNDSENQDGKRPTELTVTLSNGTQVVLNEANKWTATVENLPAYADGKPITYTWTEGSMPAGYGQASYVVDEKDSTITTITNQYPVETTDLTIKKVWDDADNQDGKRPASITATLSNGAMVTLSESNNWTATVKDLPVYVNGEKINYTWEESALTDGYKLTDSSTVGAVTTLTNSHTPEKVTVKGEKFWNDADNQDGKRPASITVYVKNGDTVVDTITVKADGQNKWKYESKELPKYADGQEITYTVEEAAVPGYTPAYNGTNITNTYTPETVVIKGTKIWDDADNQDGLRPKTVSIDIYSVIDGAEAKVDTATAVADKDGNWKYESKELPKYANGQEIEYKVVEQAVPGYTTAYDGTTITNTHKPETVNVNGSKTWVDNENQDGKRPESIKINLLADGEVIDTQEVTEASGWTWSFTDLPKNANGAAINYTITEDTVADYTAKYDGYNVINTHEPNKTSINVVKDWEDNNDQDGKRPDSVTVQLYADGKEVTENGTVELNSGNNWRASFTGLDEYKGGKKIAYTVKETGTINGYTVTVSDLVDGTYTITNSHTPETVKVTGTKTWDDAYNQDGKRPETLTVTLKADGQPVTTQEISPANNWTWSFTDLPKYANKTEINYTVDEVLPDGYSGKDTETGMTNTYTPELTSVKVTKMWDDGGDRDGLRPDSVSAELLANEQPTGKFVYLSEDNNWTATMTGLDKYENGVVIEYSFQEVETEGYTSALTGDMAGGFTLVNKHTPATVDIEGSKTWIDNNNAYDTRPESITINLMVGDEVVDTATATATNGWKWSFNDKPEFDGGEKINYTISEADVTGYTPAIEGYNVTNTLKPDTTKVAVTKVWEDGGDQDGLRPDSVTVKLFADGKATDKTAQLTEAGGWTAEFTDLDKYKDGVAIEYTVKEVTVSGYDVKITGNAADGFTVTNTHETEKTEITVSKDWVDNDNQDNVRPASVTVRLHANGTEVGGKAVTLSEANGWTYTWTGLDKKAAGADITYTVTEDAVENYETEITGTAEGGFTVTNTHEPAVTSLTVTKAWDDDNDRDGLRPDSIDVILLANGSMVADKTATLSEDNNWTYTWTGIPVNVAGTPVEYTVQEDGTPVGYEKAMTGDAVKGFTITNSRTPSTVDIKGSKTWADNDNEKGKRPESITVRLFADGEEIGSKVVTGAEEWAWDFGTLPEFKDGNAIKYEVTEDAVAGYNTAVNGYDVVNVLKTPANAGISGVKVLNTEEGLIPVKEGDFQFALFDGAGYLIETSENTADGLFTFTEFVYDEAGTYTYTIKEVVPADAEAIDGFYFKDGVIYDTSVYTYTVTVAENEEGNFEVEKTELLKDGALVEDGLIKFENYFDENFGGGGGNGDGSGEGDDDGDGSGGDDSDSDAFTEDDNKDDGAQTGDDSSMMPFALIALLALAGMTLTFRRREE